MSTVVNDLIKFGNRMDFPDIQKNIECLAQTQRKFLSDLITKVNRHEEITDTESVEFQKIYLTLASKYPKSASQSIFSKIFGPKISSKEIYEDLYQIYQNKLLSEVRFM